MISTSNLTQFDLEESSITRGGHSFRTENIFNHLKKVHADKLQLYKSQSQSVKKQRPLNRPMNVYENGKMIDSISKNRLSHLAETELSQMHQHFGLAQSVDQARLRELKKIYKEQRNLSNTMKDISSFETRAKMISKPEEICGEIPARASFSRLPNRYPSIKLQEVNAVTLKDINEFNLKYSNKLNKLNPIKEIQGDFTTGPTSENKLMELTISDLR